MPRSHLFDEQGDGLIELLAEPLHCGGRDPCNCWMAVELGTGKTIRTKEKALVGL
jgi:hypothetical protein